MIEMISEEDATGIVKEVYDDIRGKVGMVPNLFKGMAAVDPNWLKVNWQRHTRVMIDDGPLDHKYRELLAFAISVVNNCEYCINVHETLASKQGASREEIAHTRQVIELFASFNAIVNSLQGIECDIKPR